MQYIITSNDERKFIILLKKTGTFIDTTNKEQATRFDRKKAMNILKNNFGGRSTKYKVIEYNSKSSSKKEINKPMINHIEDFSTLDIKPCVNQKIPYDLQKLCKDLIKAPALLENEKIRLKNQLIRICRAITDISHYQEFNPHRSASQRCIIEKLESQILTKRREVKDNIFYIELINRRLEGEELTEDDLLLHGRAYYPREFTTLFETNEIPDFNEWWNTIEGIETEL